MHGKNGEDHERNVIVRGPRTSESMSYSQNVVSLSETRKDFSYSVSAGNVANRIFPNI